MRATKLLTLAGVGVFSGLLMSQTAFADSPFGNHIRNDRAEVGRDYRELNRDRRELHRDLRSGAPADEIARDRGELRQDWRELARDRWDIRRDRDWYYNNWNRYPYYYGRGWYDRYGRWHPYWR